MGKRLDLFASLAFTFASLSTYCIAQDNTSLSKQSTGGHPTYAEISIYGRITDKASGLPIQGARVAGTLTVHKGSDTIILSDTVLTKSNGTFTCTSTYFWDIDSQKPSFWRSIQVSADGYSTEGVTVATIYESICLSMTSVTNSVLQPNQFSRSPAATSAPRSLFTVNGRSVSAHSSKSQSRSTVLRSSAILVERRGTTSRILPSM